MNARPIGVLEKCLWIAIWVGLGAYAVITLWLGWLGMSYPYQLDYGEGIVLWFARELSKGHSIYARALLASSNYPPLSMALSALLMPIFGDGYLGGRLLSFTAAVGVTVLIYRIVALETREQFAAALAALFFFGSTYVYHWVPLFRADLIGLGFTFAGIYFVWKHSRHGANTSRQKMDLLFAFCLFLLALYTKQTLIAAPAAAFLALMRQNKRVAILFTLGLGAAGGALYLVIDYATRGGFTFGLIDSNATIFLPRQLMALLGAFITTFAVLLGLAAWEWIGRVRIGQLGVLEAYGVTSLATLIFAGRVGAWENYFFEVIAVISVLSGFRVYAIRTRPHMARAANFLLTIILLFQLGLYARDHDPRIAMNLVAHDYPANQQLAALLARTNGIIISEDMGALVTSGKDVAYYTFQYSSLARAGKWDQSWELSGLHDGKFPLVVLERGTREDLDHYRRFTREFITNLDRYYQKGLEIGKYEIYSPAPPLTLQSASFGDAIALVGWSLLPKSQPPNSGSQIPNPSLQISIVWQAQSNLSLRYKTFLHLVNEKGDKVTQEDMEPHGGAYPTTRWAPGEMVREAYTLKVPGDLSAGKYSLYAGWYNADTGERLPVRGAAEDSFVLTTLEVR